MSEYECDRCDAEVPDGSGIYVNDDTERICGECAEIRCRICGETREDRDACNDDWHRDTTARFDRWLREGYEAGWIGPPVCSTHDGTPSTAEEDDLFDNGEDICVFVARLYTDSAEKAAVEANHSPSRWRATNAWQIAGDKREGNNH